jgi:hypothetical protein
MPFYDTGVLLCADLWICIGGFREGVGGSVGWKDPRFVRKIY